MKDGLNISCLPNPTDRYVLGKKLGSGIFGEVYKATDSQAGNKSVAIKIQVYSHDKESHIQDEYKILRDFTNHSNIIDFYGVFCEKIEHIKKIWFVLEVSIKNNIKSIELNIVYIQILFAVMRMWICHRYGPKALRD